jgi:hypothetical protein
MPAATTEQQCQEYLLQHVAFHARMPVCVPACLMAAMVTTALYCLMILVIFICNAEIML